MQPEPNTPLKTVRLVERDHVLREGCVSEPLHPSAPHHLPGFITAPGDTDVLMVAVGILLIGAVLGVGNLYLHLHTMPERMAHKSQKLQFEIVAVLGLLALFTHNHLFWVIGLFLAMVDLPDFGTPLRPPTMSSPIATWSAPTVLIT